MIPVTTPLPSAWQVAVKPDPVHPVIPVQSAWAAPLLVYPVPPAVTVTEAIPLAHLIEGRAETKKPPPLFEIENPVTAPSETLPVSPVPASTGVNVPELPPAQVIVGSALGE